jgi:hypothetical protein
MLSLLPAGPGGGGGSCRQLVADAKQARAAGPPPWLRRTFPNVASLLGEDRFSLQRGP